MESQAAKQRTPKRRPSAGTPGSDKVKNALHKVSLQYVLGRVAASDPALGALDLTNHAQFLGLTSAQKARAIEVMATGKGLHTLKLNSLALSNDHAPAVASLIRGSRHEIQALGLEGNNFTEAGVLEIAAALTNHAFMQELSLAHQRTPPSAGAAAAMVEAMETVPTLVQLGLGTIRDAGMRWRIQSMQSRALERLRQERLKRNTRAAEASAGGGNGGGSGNRNGGGNGGGGGGGGGDGGGGLPRCRRRSGRAARSTTTSGTLTSAAPRRAAAVRAAARGSTLSLAWRLRSFAPSRRQWTRRCTAAWMALMRSGSTR